MINAEYRLRPRDSLKRRKVRGPELFGIARDVDQSSSVALRGVIKAIPRLSEYLISAEKVEENPSQKLLNRGLVSSVLARSNNKYVEPKDLRRWETEIIDAVNGRGSSVVEMNWRDFEPGVVDSRGKFIGSLLVKKSSPHFQQLMVANEIALESLKDETRANSSDSRAVLQPRIDLYKVRSPEIAHETIERVGRLLAAESAMVVLNPARGYTVTS